jgi:hypothetical protein
VYRAAAVTTHVEYCGVGALHKYLSGLGDLAVKCPVRIDGVTVPLCGSERRSRMTYTFAFYYETARGHAPT